MATNVGCTFLKILDEEFPENHVSARSSTGTLPRSATVVCRTSSRKSKAATNQSYRNDVTLS